MATILLGKNEVHTSGDLPPVGSLAPGFTLTKQDFSSGSLSDFRGKKVILNMFPSLDTGICAASVRKFNEAVTSHENTVVLCISKDLPTAHKRFCVAEGIENVINLSDFKDNDFTDAYKNKMVDGSLKGLLSRSIVVIDENGVVKYTEQVPSIGQEPDFEAALATV